MYHAHNGLFFERLLDGSVRVFKTAEDDSAKKEMDVTINADIWASVIASMSAGGEENYRWYLAKEFHESVGKAKLVLDNN